MGWRHVEGPPEHLADAICALNVAKSSKLLVGAADFWEAAAGYPEAPDDRWGRPCLLGLVGLVGLLDVLDQMIDLQIVVEFSKSCDWHNHAWLTHGRLNYIWAILGSFTQ